MKLHPKFWLMMMKYLKSKINDFFIETSKKVLCPNGATKDSLNLGKKRDVCANYLTNKRRWCLRQLFDKFDPGKWFRQVQYSWSFGFLCWVKSTITRRKNEWLMMMNSLKICPSETWCRCHRHHVLLTLGEYYQIKKKSIPVFFQNFSTISILISFFYKICLKLWA